MSPRYIGGDALTTTPRCSRCFNRGRARPQRCRGARRRTPRPRGEPLYSTDRTLSDLAKTELDRPINSRVCRSDRQYTHSADTLPDRREESRRLPRARGREPGRFHQGPHGTQLASKPGEYRPAESGRASRRIIFRQSGHRLGDARSRSRLSVHRGGGPQGHRGEFAPAPRPRSRDDDGRNARRDWRPVLGTCNHTARSNGQSAFARTAESTTRPPSSATRGWRRRDWRSVPSTWVR
jgi:hypothetical protein